MYGNIYKPQSEYTLAKNTFQVYRAKVHILC